METSSVPHDYAAGITGDVIDLYNEGCRLSAAGRHADAMRAYEAALMCVPVAPTREEKLAAMRALMAKGDAFQRFALTDRARLADEVAVRRQFLERYGRDRNSEARRAVGHIDGAARSGTR